MLFGGLHRVFSRGDLDSARLVGRFTGLVAAQNGAPVVWLQSRICFCLLSVVRLLAINNTSKNTTTVQTNLALIIVQHTVIVYDT